jgi:hypothetical protein
MQETLVAKDTCVPPGSKIAREHGRPRQKDARLATWLTNTYLQESSMEQQRRPSDPLETILMRVLVLSY